MQLAMALLLGLSLAMIKTGNGLWWLLCAAPLMLYLTLWPIELLVRCYFWLEHEWLRIAARRSAGSSPSPRRSATESEDRRRYSRSSESD